MFRYSSILKQLVSCILHLKESKKVVLEFKPEKPVADER
jgi:hypothetical protein